MPGWPSHTHQDLRRIGRLLFRHVRYGKASLGWAPSEAKRRDLEHLFRAVNAHLAALRIDYALAYGTLLGWHRDRRLIEHDSDIDFAAPVSAYRSILDSAPRLPRGFKLYDTSHRHHGPKLYISYRGWEADVYFWIEDHGTLRSTERSENPGETKPFPREYFFPLQPTEFLGAKTNVPAQPVALLTHHYGYLGPDAVRDPVTRYFVPRRPSGA